MFYYSYSLVNSYLDKFFVIISCRRCSFIYSFS